MLALLLAGGDIPLLTWLILSLVALGGAVAVVVFACLLVRSHLERQEKQRQRIKLL